MKKEKKNISLLIVKQPKKGPVNKPIIFDNITEGIKYIKNNP